MFDLGMAWHALFKLEMCVVSVLREEVAAVGRKQGGKKGNVENREKCGNVRGRKKGGRREGGKGSPQEEEGPAKSTERKEARDRHGWNRRWSRRENHLDYCKSS